MDSSASTVSPSSAANPVKLQLSSVLEDIFMVLTQKENEIIVKRFCLNNQPRQTLERIGQHFSVTRERVRQIEKIALGKLRRTVENTKLRVVIDLARSLVTAAGGVTEEGALVSAILRELAATGEADPHIVRLALHIDHELVQSEKTNVWRPFWRLNRLPLADIKDILDTATQILSKAGDVVPAEKLLFDLRQQCEERGKTYTNEFLASVLAVDVAIKGVDGGYGLMTWRHINPRSIRDKAYIVLKQEKKPLHFVEIANRIAGAGFDRKVVTTQAVHNELIRYDQFVLVGRGLYALKEWGYKEGTVAEIIESLLRKKSPMTKQEIIQGVLKQRYVKKGTISLNLQKNSQFVRVGRAVYALDDKKKA